MKAIMNLKGAITVLMGAGLLVAPLQTRLTLGGDMGEYLRYDTLSGQVPYVLSKLCALYAIELVWLQALLGLLRLRLTRAGWVQPGVWRRIHTTLGIGALLAILAHVTLFVIATSMRNRSLAVDLLLPWGHGVYRTWVAFGAASLWLVLLAAAVQLGRLFDARSRLRLHRLVFAAAVLIVVHSLAIGSESRSGLMALMYGFMATTLCAVLMGRLIGSGNAERAAPQGMASRF
jgi:predicted ferric reductase